MQYHQLGDTGTFVSRIALGTMTFGGAGNPIWDRIGGLDETAADELVGIALDSGVNLIDTADIYARGECEEILGRVLGARRRDVVLATKVLRTDGPRHQRRRLVPSTPDARAGGQPASTADRPHRPLPDPQLRPGHARGEETLGALDDMVRSGKVRYVGASNLAAWQLSRALAVSDRRGLARFATLQAYYSLVGRDIDRELLPMVCDQELGLLVYSPLAGGFLSGKFTREGTAEAPARQAARQAQSQEPPVELARGYDVVDVLRAVAARHETSVARVALAWTLAQRGVTAVIVGARRPDQLLDNLAASDIALSPPDLAELDGVSALTPEYPARVQLADRNGRVPRGTRSG